MPNVRIKIADLLALKASLDRIAGKADIIEATATDVPKELSAGTNYIAAEDLKPGDTLYIADDGKLTRRKNAKPR